MKQRQTPDAELTYFRVGLDYEATELLLGLSEVVGTAPRELLARLVRDILIEDAEAHSGRAIEVEGPTRH